LRSWRLLVGRLEGPAASNRLATKRMKLLFLCKRFPQGRDLLTRPYGRFHYLPRELAALGHRVHVALLSYRGLESAEASQNGVTLSSDDVWPRPRAYLARLERVCAELRPDWVVGASDSYFAILARRLANRHGARLAVDAYDDFESYIPWALPLHALWRRALRAADLVTAAGPQLASLLARRGAREPHVLPMAADPQFRALNREASRATLALPTASRLIGQIGAFDRTRGADVLLRAVEQVRREQPDVALVLSGRASSRRHSPPAIYGVGYVPDEQLPALVNSLDVACVSLADNAFGRSSYPAKLCEAMACRVPVVATDLETTRWMLRGDARALARVGSAESMAEKILARLSEGRCDYGAGHAWPDVGALLDGLLAGRS
jgi:glycosyltransferase involved in cell wall biosynthesis